MTPFRLITHSLLHYRGIHLAVLCGVALTSAILSGSLVVGDSVRESLRRNAAARIAGAGPVAVGGERFLTAALADRVSERLGGGLVAPLLQVEGTVSARAGGARANRVQVVGVDGRFFGLSEEGAVPESLAGSDWTAVNDALADRLGAESGDTLIVRVEMPGALSRDAPLSGESEQTTPFTGKIDAVLGAEQFGRYSLRVEQVPVPTVFLPLAKLQGILEQEGRANVFLGAAGQGQEEFQKAFEAEWDLADVMLSLGTPASPPASADDREPGLAVEKEKARGSEGFWTEAKPKPEGGAAQAGAANQKDTEKENEVGEEGVLQFLSGRVFFDADTVAAIEASAERSSPVLTYLVNEIRFGERSTPYSMVAGTGLELKALLDEPLPDDGILLSDWLAEDLGADTGDELRLAYYVMQSGRQLEEKTATFTVAGVRPLGEGGWDRSWTPNFPGIFDVDDLDEWEPGIPIDRDRIRDKDEDYWDEHRATPKAFVSLEAARKLWANRFGDTTAVRVTGLAAASADGKVLGAPASPPASADGNEPGQTGEKEKDKEKENKVGDEFSRSVADALRAHLALPDLGVTYRDLPADAAAAVAQSFDFGQLFAYMSFFLIAAALVLTALVFVFGIEQRSSQIGLLLALGFTRRRARRFFLAEAAMLAVTGSLVGLAAGAIYTRLALAGMSGAWRDAAAGIEFVYFLRPVSLAVAFGLTLFFALAAVWLASRRVMAFQPSELITGSEELAAGSAAAGGARWWRRKAFLGAVLGLLGGAGCLLAPKVPGTMAEQGLFFGAGFLFTLAGVCLCSLVISTFGRPSEQLRSLGQLGRQHTVRRRGRSLAVVGLMAAGVFMVTAINSFRLEGERGAERRGSGTGGFAYTGESTLPVYEDLDSEQGREKYGLAELVGGTGEDGSGAGWIGDSGKSAAKASGKGIEVLSFRVSDGDDASCLNLNRAQRPRLMAVDADRIAELDPFTFAKVLPGEDGESSADASPWEILKANLDGSAGKTGSKSKIKSRSKRVSAIPGIVDMNTATYALQMGLGDRIAYETGDGERFDVVIAGLLETSLLQGNVIISEEAFVERFPDSGGYRFFLLDGPDPEVAGEVSRHLTRMLGDRGLEMRPAADKLNEYNAVQNTYLSIFSTLGGMGLLLGTVGLSILVGRNVLERRGQLGVMEAVGFTRRSLAGMVFAEHWFLHVAGVVVGLAAAAVAVLPKLQAGAGQLPMPLIGLLNGAVLLGGLAFCWVAARVVLRGPLMESLRNE